MELSYIEATPLQGYLTHAIANQPEHWHQSAPWCIVTYHRALCGVGRGGMRVRQDKETLKPRPWQGVDGCYACHVAVHKIKEGK